MATARKASNGAAIAGMPEAAPAPAGSEKLIGDDSPAAFESADEAEIPPATTTDEARSGKPEGKQNQQQQRESGSSQTSLSIRERELVLRAKQLKLAQREKEIAEEKTKLMEKQLELEERLASRLYQPPPAANQHTQALKEVEGNLMKGADEAVRTAATTAQRLQTDAKDAQVDLISRVHSLEEKVNQAALVRLGLMPPVPPALFPVASSSGPSVSVASGKVSPPAYDNENMYSSYYPTQKAQAALHSAKATSEMPKLESLKKYFESKDSQITMRLEHVAFNLNNLQKLEDEISKKKQEIKNNIYMTCGGVQELIELRQNELLKEVDAVYLKHTKKIEEHRRQVVEAQRNLLEARQLSSVVVAGTDIVNANVDWDRYREQFEASMNQTEQRIVWFNAMKISSLQETNSLFNLDCNAIANTINRRMVFNYFSNLAGGESKGGPASAKLNSFELYRRVWDALVEVAEDVSHGPQPSSLSGKPQPILNDYQFQFLMTKVAELNRQGTLTTTTPTATIRDIVTLLFAESREQHEEEDAEIAIGGPRTAEPDEKAKDDIASANAMVTKEETVRAMQQRLEKLENFIATTFEKLNLQPPASASPPPAASVSPASAPPMPAPSTSPALEASDAPAVNAQ